MSDFRVITRAVGMVNTNCHILYNEFTKEAVIIDAPDRADIISDIILKNQLEPKAIFLTHGHFDHILACNDLRKMYNIPVYAFEAEKQILNTTEYNTPFRISRYKDLSVEADIYLKNNQSVNIIGADILTLHTPGHTRGSACYYIKGQDILFSGDTIFYQSYGRTDLYSGDEDEIKNSILNIIFSLPEKTLVYPGHMQNTSIGAERAYNPILG